MLAEKPIVNLRAHIQDKMTKDTSKFSSLNSRLANLLDDYGYLNSRKTQKQIPFTYRLVTPIEILISISQITVDYPPHNLKVVGGSTDWNS
jgi:hypothetical protein